MKQTTAAIKAARLAGGFLLKHFQQRHIIEKKGNHDFVTEADKGAEKIIINYLRKKYPEYSMLAEESGNINLPRSSSSLRSHASLGYKWVIDPLDGTINYMLGIPFWNVAIGLLINNEIKLSVIYVPITKELFVSEAGKGATLNDKRIHVSNRKELKGSFVTFCHNNNEKEIKRNIDIYKRLKLQPAVFFQPRAGNLEMAYLANGRIDAFVNNGAKTWDSVCGTILIREAGGCVTDFSGKHWDVNKKDLLASNGFLHNDVLKIVRNI